MLMYGQIHDDEDYLEEDAANETSNSRTSDDGLAYDLDAKMVTIRSPHPTPELINRLWKTFCENVHPLTKVIHAPSLQLAIERAAINLERIPRGFEALMFAIYSMAVVSLTGDECKDMLGQSRGVLLPRYVSATKAALSRARFMSTTSLVVLQAFVLHLFSIRDTHEPRAVWSLTGLAMRVADTMGLRIDGTLLGLSPFETEIRRRIWWQLKAHDGRAAELAGQVKFLDFKLDETTPHVPTNVNDSDLYPTMTKAAIGSDRPTEMLWLMFRSDLGQFANAVKDKMRQLGKPRLTQEVFGDMDDLKMKDNLTNEIINMIETKYLRFCDPSQPLQFMTLLGGRVAINIVKFMSHHPRRWAKLHHAPECERQYVWDVSIQLLELYNMQQTSFQVRHFAWSVSYYIQWHAVIHILDTIRAEPFHPDVAKGWRLIDALYENNLEMLLTDDRPIYVAVGNLCLKAFNACVAASVEEARPLSDSPAYIEKLREQREAAKARQQNVLVKGKGRQTADIGKKSTTSEVTRVSLDNDVGPTKAPAGNTLLGESEAQQPTNTAQEIARTQDDAFWLSTLLDDDFLNSDAAGVTDLDTTTYPVQDSWLESSNDGGIDWDQWDTWFGGVHQLGPSITTRAG